MSFPQSYTLNKILESPRHENLACQSTLGTQAQNHIIHHEQNKKKKVFNAMTRADAFGPKQKGRCKSICFHMDYRCDIPANLGSPPSLPPKLVLKSTR